MPADLLYGMGVMTGLALFLFLLGIVIGGRVARRTSLILMGVVLIGVVYYLVRFKDNILLANLLPFSNLIIVGNWLPLSSAFIAGLGWMTMTGSVARRSAYAAALCGLGGIAMVAPIWGSAPQCEDRWTEGVCLQTSPRTCTAACAATLLRHHGIQATEQEMAELCLTRRGTLWQGLYRGLRLKTEGTRFGVEVLPSSVHELPLLCSTSPLMLVVGIPEGMEVDPIYTDQYGWKIGDLHSVILFRFEPNGRVRIGDPDVEAGVEYWSWEDLQVLFRGRVVRLQTRT